MKSLDEIISEAQTDGADLATLVVDLQALQAAAPVAGPKLVSLTATYDDGSTVVCPAVVAD